MNETEAKQRIYAEIQKFNKSDLSKASLELFAALGYNTDRQAPLSSVTFKEFKDTYVEGSSGFNEAKALVTEWNYVDLLFQLSDGEINNQTSIFDSKKVVVSGDSKIAIESYLFFAIGLSGATYTRTALSLITREINKVFSMPVMVLFKYGQSITLAVINRRLNKRDEQKDVLKKVTLIKDIDIQNPHRAHIEILHDLSFTELLHKHKFTNFVELHEAWQKTLDIKELNKRFYQELANWYFWAMDHVSFPDDAEKNRSILNATSLIRLITRIIFIWFIKEKGLVPEALFDKGDLKKILKEFAKDHKSHSYYNAILQNLFFGTLNQKMDERGFAREGSFQKNRINYGIKNLFRYTDMFAINEKDALEIFKDIPFLNGGLFDCLDKEDEAGKVHYTDGFSRNPKKQAIVPDFLFFSPEQEYDLNVVYGTKNKHYKIKGLIDILSNYKFTITENTPIEEEIALDPELLGKVFENLLASYNPETQTTARKQTGSFYTPREIVNYMVDESLKAYFKQTLSDKLDINEEDADAELDILFSYTEREHAFSDKETNVLINAIDLCKILDPACGSGAFPMGILHKLVHILHKLDPKNEQWKERQLHKAGIIDDPTIRDHLIADIKSAFENNELDYGRKLYLIENCIYGVDIQPIAVQIAKLRFFISLVVDQKKQPDKENLGIRSLPNLETKFVAANTLIGLEKPKIQSHLFENKELTKLEGKLKDLRHRYFSARTRLEKVACQKEDKSIRQKIAGLLEKDGWKHTIAEQIVAFDPYEQNASSLFFDPEWMFGITEGFDVVTGNPPYVQLQKEGGSLADLYKNCGYKTYERTSDIYALFYENGINNLESKGHLCFITSNKWLRASYGKSLRKLFLSNNPKLLIDCGPGVFENATVDVNILLIQKHRNQNRLGGVSLDKKAVDSGIEDFVNQNKNILAGLTEKAWFIGNAAEQSLKEKIEKAGKPLKEWDITIYRGVLTGLNEAFIVDNETKKMLCNKDPNSAGVFRPILRGRDIKRFGYEWAGLWILFIPWHFPLHDDPSIQGASKKAEIEFEKNYPDVYRHFLKYKEQLMNRNKDETGIRYEWYALQRCAATYYPEFEKEKVVWKRIGSVLRFGYDNSNMYCQDSTCIMTGSNLKYLCAFMNSKLGFKQLFDLAPKTGTGDVIVSVQALEPLLVPPITPENKHIISDIESLAEKILHDGNMIDLEAKIDQKIYQLFDLNEEEIRLIEEDINVINNKKILGVRD